MEFDLHKAAPIKGFKVRRRLSGRLGPRYPAPLRARETERLQERW